MATDHPAPNSTLREKATARKQKNGSPSENETKLQVTDKGTPLVQAHWRHPEVLPAASLRLPASPSLAIPASSATQGKPGNSKVAHLELLDRLQNTWTAGAAQGHTEEGILPAAH